MKPFGKKKRKATIRLEDGSDVKAEIVDAPFVLAEGEVDKQSLIEVTDPMLKESILSLAPRKIRHEEEPKLYKVLLPRGAAMVPSKAIKSGFRTLFMQGVRAKGNATIIQAATPVTTAYAIAAFLIGQHYLVEISRSVDRLYGEISDVSLFQTGELQAKTKSLALSLCNVLSHQPEILRNRELRFRELVNLDAEQREAEQLLSQCTGTLHAIASRDEKTFDHYAHDVEVADSYLKCQAVLAEVLGHIVESKYTLNGGRVSLEYCKGNYDRYITEALTARTELSEFHHRHVEALHMNPENLTHQKEGILYKALRIMPPFRKAKANFAPIDENLATTINTHLGEDLYVLKTKEGDLDQEVVLYVEGDKVYQKEPDAKEKK